MRFGTNYHLDALRPWTALRGTARDFGGIASAGFDSVRIVGELVLPDKHGGVADLTLWDDVSRLCEQNGLAVLALCWNVVNDRALAGHSLEDADGRHYPRGHWGLFNFMDPQLRKVALESLRSVATVLAEATVPVSFQPTNEWLLAAYPPHGWDWYSYAGEMTRCAPTQVMYDAASMSAWRDHLARLPASWQAKILNEVTEVLDVRDAPPPDLDKKGWSPVALAWAEHRARLIGRFLAEVYETVKPAAPRTELLSQSTMPVLANWASLELAALGHNPDYWFREGRSCDYLAVNVYDSNPRLFERPYFGDNDLEVWSWMSLFSEVVRVNGLSGLYVTEVGANSYWHTEDAQRYLVMRGVLTAAHFGLSGLYHLLWNDEPRFEGVNEQFFGVARDQHLQPKSALRELQLAMAVIRAARKTGDYAGPIVACVLPRKSMDLGMEQAALDATTALPRSVALTTDGLVEGGGYPPSARAAVVSGYHWVADLATFDALLPKGLPVLVPGTIGRFGTDDDDRREEAIRLRLGLGAPRAFSRINDPVVRGADDEQLATPYHLTGTYDVLDLTDAGLAEGTTVIARFGSGSVAALAHDELIVTAFPLGQADGWNGAGMTRLVSDLLSQVVKASGVRPSISVQSADDPRRAHAWAVGDVLIVMNTSDAAQRIEVQDQECGLSFGLDVAPRRFSAVRRQAVPDLALLSTEGNITVKGEVRLSLEGHGTVLLENGTVKTYPNWSTDGHRLVEVTVDGVPSLRGGSVYDEAYVSTPGTPTGEISVQARTEQRVRGQVSYHRGVQLWPPTDVEAPKNAPPRSSARMDYGHTIFAAPHTAVLKWRSAVGSGQVVNLSIVGHSEDGLVRVFEGDLPLSACGQYQRLEHFPLARSYVTATVRAADGALVPSDLEIAIDYEAHESPEVLVTRLDASMFRLRLRHPMRWEHYDVLDAKVEVLSEGRWTPVGVHIGSWGMHTRHLQGSEDWVDFFE